jgi:1-acyl-sn-glycerol-3-phosphate acyltransferase
MRAIVSPLLHALFKVLFVYEFEGEEHVPAQGPAIVAANHPSYLDPALLSLGVHRPIHFMAWDALFRVPLLGALLRAFGAFPVDVRKGRGAAAYEQAQALVEQGHLVGIFPEGQRSRTGWMEPKLREGAARLALETGAPLVPATITGAFRAWPHFRPLPKPGRIKVRFHPPIDPAAFEALDREAAVDAMTAELRRRVERSLLPGVKADLRLAVVYRKEAPWPRLYESVPPLLLATLLFWKTRSWAVVAPAYAYLAYLLADRFLVPQRRVVKWVRNASPVAFLLAFEPAVREAFALPAAPARTWLAAVAAAGLLPYLYARTLVALDAIRGALLALLLSLAATAWWSPTPLGPLIALPLFLAAYAWDRRCALWTLAAPLLAAFALGVPLWLGGRLELMPHAVAGLLAWALVRLWPLQPDTAPLERPEEPRLGLGL